MKFYDLSHQLTPQMPVYPGKDKPRIEPVASIQKEGYRETRLTFDSHLGTHIDAPAHMLEQGKTLDSLPIDVFSGKAIIISIPESTPLIEKDFLMAFQDELNQVSFVLFKTGWCKLWGSPHYFEGYPVLSAEAVNWLLSFPLKGLGFDAISADPIDSTLWQNHRTLFDKGCIIVENLLFPEDLMATTGKFSCFPVPFKDADGSPVRAILEVE